MVFFHHFNHFGSFPFSIANFFIYATRPSVQTRFPSQRWAQHTHTRERKERSKKIRYKMEQQRRKTAIMLMTLRPKCVAPIGAFRRNAQSAMKKLDSYFSCSFFLVSFHEFQPRGDSRRCSERCCSDTRLKAMP